MPIPIPGSSGGAGIQPRVPHYYLRQRQDWAIEQERLRHNEALYHLGEWIFLILMWTQLDHDRGLVARCTRCWGAGGHKARVAEAYKQPTQNECPTCFGTTFEGGFRARIVRPAMIADVEETEKQDRRGSAHPAGVTVQTMVDFRTRPGDFMIRADGSRWRLTDAQRLQVHQGYEHTNQADLGTSYTLRAGVEEIGSVAYLLPPTTATAMALLSRPMQLPGDFDFAPYEQTRAALIPESLID